MVDNEEILCISVASAIQEINTRGWDANIAQDKAKCYISLETTPEHYISCSAQA